MRSLSGRVTPGGRPVSFVRMKRVAGAAVAFGALMVLAVGSVSSATRAAGALTGHIVFTRAGGEYGDETVYVANADGTGQRRITKLGVGCCPWATPTGSRIVFSGVTHNRVTAVTAKLDGSQRVVLPLPKGTLSLAAGPITRNGAIIAREGFDDAHPAAAGIYLTRASNGKVIARVTQKHFIPGDFSPDAKRLVLFKGPNGEPPPPGSLWIVNANGCDVSLPRTSRSNVASTTAGLQTGQRSCSQIHAA
jgi:hypothetical protein